MYSIDKNCKKIYLIGIGGVSMSGIALLLKEANYEVVGTDRELSKTVQHLMENGININIGHKYENITEDIDLVVRTAAIKEDNEEIMSAKQKGIEIIDRATMLGCILKNYKNSICVAGTHGKTTTTSIIAEILLKENVDPTITVGGNLSTIGGNLKIGSKDYIVAEACEYVNSFLKFYPKIGVILNVEHDHIDFFKTLNDVLNSFNKFAKNVLKDGHLIINKDIEGFNDIINNVSCNIITFGKNDATYTYNILEVDKEGFSTFNIIKGDKILCTTKIYKPGEYNVLNAVASFVVAHTLNFNAISISNSIKEYKGIDRRYQFKGYFNEIPIYDDYAHHPTEIRELIKAVKKGRYNKIFVVFQPHTYTRTKELLSEFAFELKSCDEIIITSIFPAREKNIYNINSKHLVDEVTKYNENVVYLNEYEEIKNILTKKAKIGDIILTVGAGDVYLLGEYLVEKNRRN